jgi:restriction system protein
MTTARLTHAQAEILRARQTVGIGEAVASLLPSLDPSDLYRAALVQAISTLDHYFHGVVIDRAAAMVTGTISATGSDSKRIGLSFDAVREIVGEALPGARELTTRKHVAARLGKETLQNAEDIADALRLVGVPAAWDKAFDVRAKAMKVALGTVVTRRNRIVHQSDSDPLMPGSPTPIQAADAMDAINTVESVILAFDPHC